MEYERQQGTGLEKLVDRYRGAFRIPENLNHYSEEDLPKVEKKYIHFCLTTGNCDYAAAIR